MVRRWGVCLILFGVLLAMPARSPAVIKVTTPLSFFLDNSQYIFAAKIDKLYPEKPALVFTIEQDLKGKPDYRKLSTVVRIDKAANNENYIPEIMKRLAEGHEAVLFIQRERGTKSLGYGMVNGSWFHVLGERVDKERVVWSLISGEPVLRQSFKGTTAELKQTVIDCLAGKKKPPAPNEKEKPGFGPEAKRGALAPPRDVTPALAVGERLNGGVLFGVIPSLTVGAPLVLLAVLFPTVFGGVLVLFRQWMAFITVISVDSMLYLLFLWQRQNLRGTWWGSESGIWWLLTAVAFFGAVWAWSRQVHNLSLGSGAIETPRRTETIVLWALTVVCGAVAGIQAWLTPSFDNFDYLLFAFVASLAVGIIVHMARGWLFPLSMNPGRSTEGVILTALLLVQGGLACLRFGADADVSGRTNAGQTSAERQTELVGVRWSFQAEDAGLFLASPWIAGDRVYVAAAHPGFKNGTVFCLDSHTGKKVWEFFDTLHMLSSPCLAGDRLYIGEGFHDDANCKLWCLDAATGMLAWNFPTKGQVESSPAVAGGKVYFGAGNEGLYCLDALTGKELWRFPGENYAGRLLRFGGGPAVVDGKVYAGTGVDRNLVSSDPGETALFCLDADTGKLIWKKEVRLPAWGAPVVSKGQVFLGIGNGDIFDDAKDSSLGGLLCLEAATGKEIWQYHLGNGVLDRPAVDDDSVYFSSRSGHVYCLDRANAHKRWKRFLDSPAVAAPALAQWRGKTDSVYAVATKGKVCCLDPRTGEVDWTYDLTSQGPHLSSAPKVAVHSTPAGDRRRLYFGAGIGGNLVGGRAVLYCLEDRVRER